jgi:DNA-binding IscR family transcriptional regulator
MNPSDDEIRRRILDKLDAQYEEEMDRPVSVPNLAFDLNIDRRILDRNLDALQGRNLVSIFHGNHYCRLTPFGKDDWDKRQGQRNHLQTRQRILERLKELDDKDPGGLTSSEILATELSLTPNALFINLTALEEKNLVQLRPQLAGDVRFAYVSLTPEGRVAVETPPVDINFCFVLMPFDNAFDPVYTAISEGVTDAEMRSERADNVPDNRAIIEKIKRSIERSGLIVADMTGLNPNVLYEIGYAHGLGKECVLLTQSRSEEVPFDLRHLEHIRYSPAPEGLLKLTTAVTETILRVRSRGL